MASIAHLISLILVFRSLYILNMGCVASSPYNRRRVYVENFMVHEILTELSPRYPSHSKVEKFVKEGEFFEARMIESLHQVLTAPKPSEIFQQFLERENIQDYLTYFADLEALKSASYSDLLSMLEDVLSYYAIPSSKSIMEPFNNLDVHIDMIKRGKRENLNKNMLLHLHSVIDESLIMMVMSLFPKFLASTVYDKSGLGLYEFQYEPFPRQRASKPCNDEFDFVHLSITNEFLHSAIQSINKKTIIKTLNNKSWMASLYNILDKLPFSISIAVATGDVGFPLAYVNPYFERVTGFSKNEIIGRNCKFLQTSETESDSIRQLSVALRGAKPTKVVFTNFKKNGHPFKNYLAIKPIFDVQGVYRYVLGIQINVSQPDICAADIIMANRFLSMFPDTVLIDYL